MNILFQNDVDAISVLKRITERVSFLNAYDLILDMPAQYCQYYNPSRQYKAGEVYNKDSVKFLVLEDLTVLPIQNKNICFWYPGEYIQKDFIRISLKDNKAYKAIQFINKSVIDPALTTDGKWINTEIIA